MFVLHIAHQMADLLLACQVTVDLELMHWHRLVHCDTGYHACPASFSGAPRGSGQPPPPPGFPGLRASAPGGRGRAGRNGPQNNQGRGRSSVTRPIRQGQQPDGARGDINTQIPLLQTHSGGEQLQQYQQQPRSTGEPAPQHAVKLLQRSAGDAKNGVVPGAPQAGHSQSGLMQSSSGSARPQQAFATGETDCHRHRCTKKKLSNILLPSLEVALSILGEFFSLTLSFATWCTLQLLD